MHSVFWTTSGATNVGLLTHVSCTIYYAKMVKCRQCMFCHVKLTQQNLIRKLSNSTYNWVFASDISFHLAKLTSTTWKIYSKQQATSAIQWCVLRASWSSQSYASLHQVREKSVWSPDRPWWLVAFRSVITISQVTETCSKELRTA